MGVIGILLLRDTMNIRDGRDRRGVKSEKDWARTDPWGTPEIMSERGEQASPILTDCRRLCRYEEIQSRARPVRPKQEERRLMRILWLIESKARSGREIPEG